MASAHGPHAAAIALALGVFIAGTCYLPFAWIGYQFGSDLSLYQVLADVDRVNGSNLRVILVLVYVAALVPWVARNPRASIAWILPLVFLALVFWQALHPLPQFLSRWNDGVLGTMSLRYGAYLAAIAALLLAGFGLARLAGRPIRRGP
jgi:magnesium-transporting ATPase (P-type)